MSKLELRNEKSKKKNVSILHLTVLIFIIKLIKFLFSIFQRKLKCPISKNSTVSRKTPTKSPKLATFYSTKLDRPRETITKLIYDKLMMRPCEKKQIYPLYFFSSSSCLFLNNLNQNCINDY